VAAALAARAGAYARSDSRSRPRRDAVHGRQRRIERYYRPYHAAIDGLLDTAMATSFDAHGDARAVLVRHRRVDGGVRDRYQLHRLVPGPPMEVQLRLAADFAHLMAVKGATVPHDEHTLRQDGDGTFVARTDGGVGVQAVDVGDLGLELLIMHSGQPGPDPMGLQAPGF
jgi:hypothetical protein